MIKALIISDSHGSLENVKKIINKEKNIDVVLHLGDIQGQEEELKLMCNCPVYAVRGNCDYCSPFSLTEVVTLESNRIFMAHGHTFDINWTWAEIVNVAREMKCNYALCGHTHIPDITPFGDVIAVNPGSVSLPRQSNREPSYALMVIDDSGKTDCRIKFVREL